MEVLPRHVGSIGIDAGASSIRVKAEWLVVSRLHYRVRFGWDRAVEKWTQIPPPEPLNNYYNGLAMKTSIRSTKLAPALPRHQFQMEKEIEGRE